jgi:hypothetical protein
MIEMRLLENTPIFALGMECARLDGAFACRGLTRYPVRRCPATAAKSAVKPSALHTRRSRAGSPKHASPRAKGETSDVGAKEGVIRSLKSGA